MFFDRFQSTDDNLEWRRRENMILVFVERAKHTEICRKTHQNLSTWIYTSFMYEHCPIPPLRYYRATFSSPKPRTIDALSDVYPNSKLCILDISLRAHNRLHNLDLPRDFYWNIPITPENNTYQHKSCSIYAYKF